ncbi:DegT/DnrJ/EryC1/StrS family aminotransferase [Enhygromyxa salina]|uniref:DegT/DnrJ/EryC1/StrS family aminotransferase n=1 Tax=Enhygromyxa salina TaxID=215803 RepID=UPI002467F7DF|nr:aminotransferase class I/II-fold pyridoxal phosphate-dependent enzyme [Enhygromyxa salina]
MGPAEREALLSAFDSGWIAPLGPQVEAFERALAKRVGRSDAAATNSGTAALHLALRLLGVGPGDEVWLSTLTFVASATPITWLGAEPVFMDSEARTWNLDPELFAHALDCGAAIGRLPKAVIVVDIYGQCADYDPIVAACQRHGVALIEDAAESLGASYHGRPAGSFGELALVSFNGNKIATCGGGGMLVGDDPQVIARARWLASQAREDTAHYQHELGGYNYRLSNVLAGIGVAQVGRLDELVDHRRANFNHYAAELASLPGISFMPEPPGYRSTRWLTAVLLDSEQFGAGPEQVRLALDREGIESRPLWKPLHMQPLFARSRCIGGQFTEQLFARGLCLPSGSTLRGEDRDRVIQIIRACHRAARPQVFMPTEACA